MTRPILIVEDDPAITSSPRETLRLEGYAVESAADAFIPKPFESADVLAVVRRFRGGDRPAP